MVGFEPMPFQGIAKDIHISVRPTQPMNCVLQKRRGWANLLVHSHEPLFLSCYYHSLMPHTKVRGNHIQNKTIGKNAQNREREKNNGGVKGRRY